MEEQTTQNTQQSSQPQQPESKKGKNTGMAVVAYIIFFIPLLTDAKDDPFVKFHVKQGLVLFVCSVMLWFIIQAIPLLWILSPLFNLAILVLVIMGIINAVNGAEKQLPLIGSFAEKFKF
jgi:uncharacterized membrane protein